MQSDPNYQQSLDQGVPIFVFLMFVLPISILIDLFGSKLVVIAVFQKIGVPLIEKRTIPKPIPILVCRQCEHKSTDSWQWQYCRKCGDSLKHAHVLNSESSLETTEIKPEKDPSQFGKP